MGLAQHVTEAERVSIATEYATGQRITVLAKKYRRSRGTITTIARQLKESAGFNTVEKLRAELEHKAVNTLISALAPTDDQELAIKASPIAATVLKGIGVFANDNATGVTIAFSPNQLDWAQPKQVGSSSTPACSQAEGNPTPICSGEGADNGNNNGK